MTIKVLVVDDSNFFSKRLCELINSDPELEVIDIASDGAQAVEKAKSLNPDVITMDVNMPVMDGITAVKHIMKHKPVPVLMLSALTREGAKSTLDALEAGAVDFLLKRAEDISANNTNSQQIIDRIKLIANSKPREISITKNKSVNSDLTYKVVIIGTSTGGPVALHTILKELPPSFPLPIVIIQHMPDAFTGPFAERLNEVCEINVKEAENDDILTPGQVLLAKGGYQFLFTKCDDNIKIKIVEGDSNIQYHPSVDVTFESAAEVFGEKEVLGIILTGMGADGSKGAGLLKDKAATIWAQDEESSVVFGMPMSIINAGYADKILNLNNVSVELNKAMR